MMDSSGSSLLGLLVQKMSYLNQRQSVLAENVANADTPGYKARDVTPFTFDQAMKQANIGMAVTDPHHIVPASMAGVNAKTIKVNTYSVNPSGNSVDLEQEMMKVSQNAVDYQAMTSIYKKFVGLFKIAVKGNST